MPGTGPGVDTPDRWRSQPSGGPQQQPMEALVTTGTGRTNPGGQQQVISSFLVRDLDDIEHSCSTRALGPDRVRTLQGTIRAMGKQRFDLLVQDLDFTVEKFKALADRFMNTMPGREVNKGHIMHSLRGVKQLTGAAAWTDQDKFGKFIRLELGQYDLKQLSLKDFLVLTHQAPVPFWGRKSTQVARTEMALAVDCMQKFFATFFGEAFKGSMESVKELLETGVDLVPLNGFSDEYVWLAIERTLLHWSDDVRQATVQSPSLGFGWYPEQERKGSELAADLLRCYMEDLAQGADESADHRNLVGGKWEPGPHAHFYAEQGTFYLYKFGPEQSSPKDNGKDHNSASKKKTRQKERGSGEHSRRNSKGDESEDEAKEASARKKKLLKDAKELCAFHTKGLLGIQRGGKLVICHQGKDCNRKHAKSLKEITAAEIGAISDVWTADDKAVRDGQAANFKH